MRVVANDNQLIINYILFLLNVNASDHNDNGFPFYASHTYIRTGSTHTYTYNGPAKIIPRQAKDFWTQIFFYICSNSIVKKCIENQFI